MKKIGYYPEQFCTKSELKFIAENPASSLATAFCRIRQACDFINDTPKGVSEALTKQGKQMLSTAVEMKNTKAQFAEKIML